MSWKRHNVHLASEEKRESDLISFLVGWEDWGENSA